MVDKLSKGYHIGYFRDSPKEMPAFVGSNTETEGCVITPMGENLFSAFRYIQQLNLYFLNSTFILFIF